VNVIKNALAELYSMFVDDPFLVSLVLIWTAICYLGRHAVPSNIAGPALFLGFAVVLAASTLRKARSVRRK